MNVASLEMCQELEKLSGWHDTYAGYYLLDGIPSTRQKVTIYDDLPGVHQLVQQASAYDLGYLMSRMPYSTTISKSSERDHYGAWIAGATDLEHAMENPTFVEADTPEDALAKLCIELFKQGVLTKEDK